jgi:hypothetical protein
MTIQEAIKSGKPFKRHGWADYNALIVRDGRFEENDQEDEDPQENGNFIFEPSDMTADDWEVINE